MIRIKTANERLNLRLQVKEKRTGASCLDIEAWMPSEPRAISPLLDRLMRLIEGSQCVAGGELAVRIALGEALNNAVVHGNRMDARKLVHVRVRCMVGAKISLIVSDQGQGFDPRTIPDPLAVGNLEAEHGRGIHLMKLAMDEVSFQQGGTEVYMCKRLARNARATARGDSHHS